MKFSIIKYYDSNPPKSWLESHNVLSYFQVIDPGEQIPTQLNIAIP